MTFEITLTEKEWFYKKVDARVFSMLDREEAGYILEQLTYIGKWHPEYKHFSEAISAIVSPYGYFSRQAMNLCLKDALNNSIALGEKTDHRIDLYCEYDVLFSRCFNMKGRLVLDVFSNVLKRIPKEMLEDLDYFAINGTREKTDAYWPYPFRWIAVYYVTGGNEGYYLHVDPIWIENGERKSDTFFTGKTLYEGQKGRAVMSALVTKLSEMMEV